MIEQPDAEANVCTYLAGVPEIAALVGDRVSDRTPDTLAAPWVRVTQINDAPNTTSRSLWLNCFYLQFDCYGSEDRGRAHEEASLLVRRVRAALHALGEGATLPDAIVSKVSLGSAARMPDTGLDPARERFVLNMELHLHPRPA